MSKRPMKVILAQPRGFCAGVVRAIDIVEKALELQRAPVYVRHEIVHNRHVVDRLQEQGARFVEEVSEIPEGSTTVFSAHGVSTQVVEDSASRDLDVIDATCPLVTKVHTQAKRFCRNGCEVVLIGHANHPEVEGTIGQIPGKVILVESEEDVSRIEPLDPNRLAYVTQTTLSVDDTRSIISALKKRFPNILGPSTNDICYATQNRQTAVKSLAAQADVILVLGAKNSSNSNRLREIGENEGVPSYLVADASCMDLAWLEEARSIGITAGASAPEYLVEALVEHLGRIYDLEVSTLDGTKETVTFNIPRKLARAAKQSKGISDSL